MPFLRRRSRLPLFTLVAMAFSTGLSMPSHGGTNLTPAQARSIVAPLYEALDKPATKDVRAMLLRAGTPDWLSCSAPDVCVSLDVNVRNIEAAGRMVPDLRFQIVDVTVSGQDVIVRSVASGTPVGLFFGQPATGKSFRIMAIDVHHIANGKIIHSFHVEDWLGALTQIKVQP